MKDYCRCPGCGQCKASVKEVLTNKKIETLIEFVNLVRITGDTRLASMAIATLNKIKGLS